MLKKQDCKDKYFCVRLYILANFYFLVTLHPVLKSVFTHSLTYTISLDKQ